MKSRMTSRRATVRKAQKGTIEDFDLSGEIYERKTPWGTKYQDTAPKNPYKNRIDLGSTVRGLAYEMQPWVKKAKTPGSTVNKLKGMSSEAFEAMARREEAEEAKEAARLKDKQRRGGKTAIKKTVKAKSGRKVVKAVATKKAKTGARSYKRK